MAADGGRFVVKFYCLDVTQALLDRLGRDPSTGQLPEQLSLARALSFFDQDQVKLVAYSRVEAVSGKEAAADNTRKAIYLEPAPGGGMVQRTSEWDEGASVRIVPTVDRDGRVHIEGAYALKAINSRAPLVGVEKLDLGRPLTHATQTINPAVVLRPGEARMMNALNSGNVDTERVLLVTVDKLAD
ncbi:MAG TPA: hypothetical protein VL172_14705 [Kofleriaceae bacterium]|nr:hypothetical protein [Kofleriaceae bacterium]